MRILCIGEDSRLLSSRCEVLTMSGHSATFCTHTSARQMLALPNIDLAIFSWDFYDHSLETAARCTTKVLALHGLTMPRELLDKITHLIS
jgi:hypothetical protein